MESDLKLNIEEVEKLAYRVWYAKFEEEAKELLADHKRKMDNEYSMLKKYKTTIYKQFELLKATQSDIKRQLRGFDSWDRRYLEMDKKYKHILDIERKLSYALGEPYDKRNLKREHVKPSDEEE